MNTSKKLRILREGKKLSQEEVANMLGIDRTTYAKYENGGSIKRNVQKLANFFNVSIDYLLGNDAPSSSAHSKKDTDDLAKFLDKTEVMFDGDTYHLDDEGKQKLRNALEFVFWDAKQKNKRHKKD